jgi:hypothetical protein
MERTHESTAGRKLLKKKAKRTLRQASRPKFRIYGLALLPGTTETGWSIGPEPSLGLKDSEYQGY